jgi:predicted hydrocarbon binding protein
VTLPATALVAIRRALAAELDGDAAARALQAAGCEAGHALFPALALDMDLAALPAHRFFAHLDQLLATRGWGRLRHATPHPGVGELVGDAWLEADPAGSAGRPSCFLTTGILTAVLSRAVGQDVAVLEVACRSEGSDRCRFLFGAPQTLKALHRHMLKGDDAEAAIAALV